MWGGGGIKRGIWGEKGKNGKANSHEELPLQIVRGFFLKKNPLLPSNRMTYPPPWVVRYLATPMASPPLVM